MRTAALLFLILLGGLRSLQAQPRDVIVRTDGSETAARVLSITPNLVTFRAGADTLAWPASEVFLIRYPNGSKELLAAAKSSPAAGGGLLSAKALDRQGRLDAGRYFKAAGTFWGSYVATIVSTPTWCLGGLAGSVVLGCTQPQERNLVLPNPDLRANPAYMAGYRSRARKKKFGTAALGFGLGLATVGAASFFLVNQQ